MTVEKIEALVIGAGQAGIAMSEHLTQCGVPHLVLERARIAERWRSGRWDALVANGPAWHDRFPGLAFDTDPESFVGKEGMADYFAAYAQMIHAPVRCGVEVSEVQRHVGRPGFRVTTSQGEIDARYVIAATGAFQKPTIPALVPAELGITQIHSANYRNPGQLPDGAVMVVGSGSSGAQIADELLRAGRKVYLSISTHGRPPRAYRGRDYCWWLGVLNKWDADATPGADHVTIAVSGAQGGMTVNFRQFAARGMVLLGRAGPVTDGVMTVAPTLSADLAKGDADYLAVLDEADAYIARNGLDLPAEPAARDLGPDSDCITDPIASLDLVKAGVTSIVWATGYRNDYSWIKLDGFDAAGKPKHQRGVSTEPGLYFLGLPYQSRRGSSFIWGVWHDAKFVADHIATKQSYLAYAPGAPPASPPSAAVTRV